MRNGKLVEEAIEKAKEVHFVQEDIKPYWSLASNSVVDGKTQRKRDLKATGCRAVDPSEKEDYLRDKSNDEPDFKFDGRDLYHIDKIMRGQRLD